MTLLPCRVCWRVTVCERIYYGGSGSSVPRLLLAGQRALKLQSWQKSMPSWRRLRLTRHLLGRQSFSLGLALPLKCSSNPPGSSQVAGG
uniref:ATP binding cassette subfamily F member 3 n=1 Tax=Macaca fascicularis TaxID=9541 RepID=G7NZ03_MACFA